MVIKKRLPTKGGPHKKKLFLVLRPGLFKNKQTFIIFSGEITTNIFPENLYNKEMHSM